MLMIFVLFVRQSHCYINMKYGMNSITSACIHSWNNTTKILESPSSISLSEVKKHMSNHYINSY